MPIKKPYTYEAVKHLYENTKNNKFDADFEDEGFWNNFFEQEPAGNPYNSSEMNVWCTLKDALAGLKSAGLVVRYDTPNPWDLDPDRRLPDYFEGMKYIYDSDLKLLGEWTIEFDTEKVDLYLDALEMNDLQVTKGSIKALLNCIESIDSELLIDYLRLPEYAHIPDFEFLVKYSASFSVQDFLNIAKHALAIGLHNPINDKKHVLKYLGLDNSIIIVAESDFKYDMENGIGNEWSNAIEIADGVLALWKGGEGEKQEHNKTTKPEYFKDDKLLIPGKPPISFANAQATHQKPLIGLLSHNTGKWIDSEAILAVLDIGSNTSLDSALRRISDRMSDVGLTKTEIKKIFRWINEKPLIHVFFDPELLKKGQLQLPSGQNFHNSTDNYPLF